MLPRIKLASTFLLLAFMLSFLPAGTNVGYAAQAACVDSAELILPADPSVSDGTFAPGAAFKKTWRIKNNSLCTWETTYAIVSDGGEKMGGPASQNLAAAVNSGATVDISLNLVAPSTPGNYSGFWNIKNAAGTSFGPGVVQTKFLSVNIVVTGATNAPVATGDYDFTAHASEAAWSSGAGALTFGGSDGNVGPLALKLDKPKFEDGKDTYGSGLLFIPNNAAKGFVQAIYPAFTVQSGDRFLSQIGCRDGATTCYVAYRLQYQTVDSNGNLGGVRTFWKEPPFRERFEGKTYPVNISLSPLAGQNVKFILSVTDYDGVAAGDSALWGNPRIIRSGAPANCIDKAQFVKDVTYPDGTIFAPNATFTKTWQIKNIGSCTWTTAYQLYFYSGNKMSGPDAVSFDTAASLKPVAPGQTVDISVNLTAPATAATYKGFWKFKNNNGVAFGVVRNGNVNLAVSQTAIWVDIKVSGTVSNALTLTMKANPTTYKQAGDKITFTYEIKNSGTGSLGPAQFTVSGGSLGAAPVNCDIATKTLLPGEMATCTFEYTITTADLGTNTITNKAIASGGGAGPSPEASATITKQ